MIASRAARELLIGRWASVNVGVSPPFTADESSVFLDAMGDRPHEALMVTGIDAGPAPSRTYGPAYVTAPRVLVYARAVTEDRAAQLIRGAWRAVTVTSAVTTEAPLILRSEPVSPSPRLSGRDPEQRFVYVFGAVLWIEGRE